MHDFSALLPAQKDPHPKHLGFARLQAVDCSELSPPNSLDALISKLQDLCRKARKNKGRTAISIDYLESLGNRDTQAFFQTLNGLLRKSPVVIVWPVTKQDDAESMLRKAQAVSGTIFDDQFPILSFRGPDPKYYPAIASNAIAVFNQGSLLQEFVLTPSDLDFLRDDLVTDPESPEVPTVRDYLRKVVARWSKSSGQLDEMMNKMPRPNEVWVVFCHSKAEALVGQFANKGKHPASAWKAYHAKLWDYIPGTKKEARWPNPTRLQYAIEGAFTTRILYVSPQSVISSVLSYGGSALKDKVKLTAPDAWSRKETARRQLKSTALYRQLIGEEPGRGQTPGGPAANARKLAEKPFKELNSYLTGTGRDRHVNRAIATVLEAILPEDFGVYAEEIHPWIPSVIPDIRIDTPDGRQINLEFCYTNKYKDVWRVPDYVLDKLSSYMDGLYRYVGNSDD